MVMLYNVCSNLSVYDYNFNRFSDNLQPDFSDLEKKEDINFRIKALRERLDIKQGKMARILGVSQSSLSEMENGKCEVSTKVIIGISKNFSEIDEKWLLTGDGEMYKTHLVVEGVPCIANHVPKCDTDDEKQLLEEFRCLTDEQKADVLQAIHAHREFSQLKERLARLEQERKT